ncbi:hypothetical protein K2X05_10225 [bacterium]|nr:hypothetical protein [bacterium]
MQQHFEWVQSLKLPLLPTIVDLTIRDKALEVTYEEILGNPLWKVLQDKDFSHLRDCFLSIIEQLKVFSQSFYDGRLPPFTGIIHSDFHMGNVIERDGQFFLVDLENISLGCFSKMQREFALNIIGDPGFSFASNQPLLKRLTEDLCIDQSTFSCYFKDVEKVVYHFYDYYREKSDYFKKEKWLKEMLVEHALQLDLAKI